MKGMQCVKVESKNWTQHGTLTSLREFRSDCITGGPKLKLGTKWPSMMSMWSQSAPISVICWASRARWERSHESKDGATMAGQSCFAVMLENARPIRGSEDESSVQLRRRTACMHQWTKQEVAAGGNNQQWLRRKICCIGHEK